MTKSEAIAIFGSVGALASALGITRQAVYQWEEDLPQERRDRVIGAAVRLGMMKVERGPVEDHRRAGRTSAGAAEGAGAETPSNGSNDATLTANKTEDAA
jgi:hypothetical protein